MSAKQILNYVFLAITIACGSAFALNLGFEWWTPAQAAAILGLPTFLFAFLSKSPLLKDDGGQGSADKSKSTDRNGLPPGPLSLLLAAAISTAALAGSSPIAAQTPAGVDAWVTVYS